jgi:hypothetical protein
MEVVWELPDPDTKYIDICKLEQAVRALEERQRTPVDEEPGRFFSEVHALPTLLTSQRQQIPVCAKPNLFCSTTPVLTEQQVVHEPAEARAQTGEPIQEPRRVLNGPSLSDESQATIPWQYFRNVTRAIMLPWLLAWVACLGYSIDLLANPEHFLQQGNIALANEPRMLEAVRVSQMKPKGTPSALACAGNTVVLASGFDIFVGELPTAFPDEVEYTSLTSALTARNLTGPWTSLAALHSASEPHMLLLETAGRAVWEHSLVSNGGVPRRWPVGPSLGAPLIQISAVFGPAAVEECGSSEHNWFVTAVTDKQRLAVLCPEDGVLQPVRFLAHVLPSTIHAHKLQAGELMQVSMDGSGGLLHRSGLGSTPQSWRLPEGSWVPGFCQLLDGAVILASQSMEAGVDVWRIAPQGPDPDLPLSLAFLSPGKATW